MNYVEALNEYDPQNTDIRKYLNLIRERAGFPKYPKVCLKM
ncbi:RagB/SusD family nutrient uptake outer membrane protein [Bacteroides faecalis]|nr:RagB/SusD family nutrient uptake outer membrane protein [Bacteroides faecalis]